MKVILAPYAAACPNGRPNAKNYPWWEKVVELLNVQGCEVVQIGLGHELQVAGTSQFLRGWPYHELRRVIDDADCWLSVDSWLPHFCATERLKGGVVVWSQSSPRIWGYPHNTNLLKSERYLRERQYAPWYEADFNADAFVSPEEVVRAVNERLQSKAA